MKISFFGLGYVGLASAVCFAEKGFPTLCFDKDQKRLSLIAEGKPPFYEPRIKEMLEKTIKKQVLRCTPDPHEAVAESDLTFITVGTPSRLDGSINLSNIKEAARTIGRALAKKGRTHLTVVKSTVIPGTTLNLVKPTLERYLGRRLGEQYSLCVNPEFLREGAAVKDTFHPNRIIIGELDRKSGDALQKVFTEFHGDPIPPLIRTSFTNAELIKYATNAYLAMKISFINMIANLCEKLPQADVTQIADGIGLDKRIGRLFLDAGVGWGGSCFRKDITALRVHATKLLTPVPLLDATLTINNKQPLKVVDLARKALRTLRNKRIAILGLSFKPKTDDMRDAVSIPIIRALLHEKAKVVAYDPGAIQAAAAIFGDTIVYANSAKECIRDADCAIILTEWDEFKNLSPSDYRDAMRKPFLIDGRRIYPPRIFTEKLGYKAIGLGL